MHDIPPCSVEGEGGTGYMAMEEFLQVLTSPDLGLRLEENEQAYITAQVIYHHKTNFWNDMNFFSTKMIGFSFTLVSV